MRKQLSIKQIDEHIDDLDMLPVLKSQVRQVRWLYNNSNKCTMVYEEKLVVLMIHRLRERIFELENMQK